MANKQSKISILLDINAKGFDAELSRAQRKLKKFGGAMKTVGRGLSIGLTAPLVLVGRKSAQLAVEFEKSMAKVQAISGATESEFKALSASAREFGANTAFTAAQVSELQLELSKLGFKPQEIQDATEGILDLAFAFDGDLASTASVAASTLNQFGLGAKETGRVADVMAAAFSNSALDLESFAESMKNAGPVARAAGLDVKETSALLGILANNGIKGSDAGTKLKIALTEIQVAGLPVKETIQQIVDGTFSFEESIGLLGKRAQILNPILASNADELKALTSAIDGSEGALGRAAAIMENTTDGALKRMNSALEAAGESLGRAMLPAINAVADAVSFLAKKFSEMGQGTQLVVATVGLLVAAIGPLLFIIGSLATGIAAALPVLATLGATIATVGAAAAASSLLPLAIAAAAAAGTWYILGKAMNRQRNTIDGLDNSAFNASQSMSVLQRSFSDVAKLDLTGAQTEMAGLTAELEELERLAKQDLLFDTTGGQQGSDRSMQERLQGRADEIALTERQAEVQERLDYLLEQEAVAAAQAAEDAIEALNEAVVDAQGEFDGLIKKFSKYKEIGVDTEPQEVLRSTEKALVSIIDAMIEAGQDASEWAKELAIVRQRMEDLDDLEVTTKIGKELDDNRTGFGRPQDLEQKILFKAEWKDGSLDAVVSSLKGFDIFDDFTNQVSVIQAGINALIGGFGTLFSDIASGAKTGGQAMLELATKVISAVTAQISALLIQSAIQTALATGPAALVSAPALIGVGLGIASAAIGAIPQFAEGGAVLGPTLAMVGEKPGSRGEAIVPFEKIGQFVDQVTGGEGSGSTNVIVTGRISGADIALSNSRGGVARSRRR